MRAGLAQTSSPVAATPAGASGMSTGLVEVSQGRELFLEQAGTGEPVVVLEAGYRSPATVWTDDLIEPGSTRTMVLPGVAAFARVCAYDRPGTDAIIDDALQRSRSTPVPMPRTAQSVVSDLHAMLRIASLPAPFVMVGHSLGGLFVRLYASTYPDDVAGMVLVDAWYEGLQTLLTPMQWADYVRFNSEVAPVLQSDPDYETIDFAAASATMRLAAAAHPLRPMPLVVLSHGQPFGVAESALGFPPAVLEQAWARAQQELATLVPNARQVIAQQSGHYIQLQQPDLVIAAVRQVVEAVRAS